MNDPLAYHITWSTYGTWLHGDERGWIKSGEPGIREGDGDLRKAMRAAMTDEPARLDDDQRKLVEDTIRQVISFRGWELHAINVRTPETVMEQLKAWCSRRLSERLGRKRKWWTEHGSTKWINDANYLANAVQYVQDGQ